MTKERVPRKLAAILAADVVGYSRLMEADEELTRARLRVLHYELIDPRLAADGSLRYDFILLLISERSFRNIRVEIG